MPAASQPPLFVLPVEQQESAEGSSEAAKLLHSPIALGRESQVGPTSRPDQRSTDEPGPRGRSALYGPGRASVHSELRRHMSPAATVCCMATIAV